MSYQRNLVVASCRLSTNNMTSFDVGGTRTGASVQMPVKLLRCVSLQNSSSPSLNALPSTERFGLQSIRSRLSSTSPAMAGSEKLSIAPMMEYTDVHYRSFARLLTKKTWLYTEMIVDSTLRYNEDSDRFLWFPEEQHPIACQLGGSTPEFLAEAARIVSRYNYDEINVNCGCPSDRVAGAGCFGAALMMQPELVASCAQSISEAVDTPVTIKCRLGVDDVDSYDDVVRFVRAVSQGSSVQHFIIHARKCLLSGLSPHQNRTIPPLKYEWVFALKRDFPDLQFSLNGGVRSIVEVQNILNHRHDDAAPLRSVMIGRAAYDQPWPLLSNADRLIFGEPTNPAQSRRQKWIADGRKQPSVRTLVKPVLNLFHGEKHGHKWKAVVDETLKTATSLSELFDRSLGILPDAVLDSRPEDIAYRDTPAFATGQLPPAVQM